MSELTLPEGDLDWPVSSVPLAGVTEIRVHGVGGSTPMSMLGDANARQVTGDTQAGFWRGADRPVPDGDAAAGEKSAGQPRWHREAYSWGNLTSRSLRHLFWLMIFPFTMINLAGWMVVGKPAQQPAAGAAPGRPVRTDWRIGFQQELIRLIALMFTWTYVLFAVQMVVDFGAWQCIQVGQCRAQSFLRWLGVRDNPAHAVVVLTLVPLLLLAGLAWISEASRRQFEAYTVAEIPPAEPDAAAGKLTDRAFWSGAGYALHTRTIHVCSALALMCLPLLAIAWHGSAGDRRSARGVAVEVVIALVAVFIALCVLAMPWKWLRRGLFPWQWVPFAVVGPLLVAAGCLAWSAPTGPAAPTLLEGLLLNVFDVVIVTVYVLGLVLAVVAVSAHGRAKELTWVRRLPVPGAFVVTSIATMLLFGVLAAFAVWVARWLSPHAGSTPFYVHDSIAEPRLMYSAAYIVFAQLTAIGLMVLAAVVACAIFLSHRVQQRRIAEVLEWEKSVWRQYNLAGGRRAMALDRRWIRRVASHIWRAEAARWIEYTAAGTAVMGAVVAISFSVMYAWKWLGTQRLGWCVLAMLALGLGIVAVGYAAGQRSAGRRVAGWATAVAAFAVTAWLLALVLRGGLPEHPIPAVPDWLPLVPNAGLASTLLTAIPVASALILRQGMRDQNTRRLVAAAWDVGTFWPRTFHPLAPPSYAERAIPEIVTRVSGLLKGGHAVALLGHSQGAVLVTAAAAQLAHLPREEQERLSIVTYGNPVANLYMRWFPLFVNTELLTRINANRVAGGKPQRWVNFFRYTDPIGRELFRSAPLPPWKAVKSEAAAALDKGGAAALDPRGARAAALDKAEAAAAVADPRGAAAATAAAVGVAGAAPGNQPERPVFTVTGSDAVDCWLPDPPTDLSRPGDTMPRVRGHSHGGYVRQSPFDTYLRAEIRRLDPLARTAEAALDGDTVRR